MKCAFFSVALLVSSVVAEGKPTDDAADEDKRATGKTGGSSTSQLPVFEESRNERESSARTMFEMKFQLIGVDESSADSLERQKIAWIFSITGREEEEKSDRQRNSFRSEKINERLADSVSSARKLARSFARIFSIIGREEDGKSDGQRDYSDNEIRFVFERSPDTERKQEEVNHFLNLFSRCLAFLSL